MAENPVRTIARLLGGVVLMQGRLGHQILGQLLIMNSNEVALAGAAAVVAATSGQRNAAVQVALRTAVPALAVRGLLLKQERRIERREELVADRERAVEERGQAIKTQAARLGALEAERAVATGAIVALERTNRELQEENRNLRIRDVRRSGLKVSEDYQPAEPAAEIPKKKKASTRPGTPRKPKV